MNAHQSAHESLWQRLRRHFNWLFAPPYATSWQPSKVLGIQPMAMPERPGLPPWAGRPLLEITPVSMPAVQRIPAPALPISPIRERALSHGWSHDPRLDKKTPKKTRLTQEERADILRGVYSDLETVPSPTEPGRDPALVTIGDERTDAPEQHNPLALTGAAVDLFAPANEEWLTNEPRETTHALDELADLATMRHNSDTLEVPAYMRKKRAKSEESE